MQMAAILEAEQICHEWERDLFVQLHAEHGGQTA
jgi:hypothetical protein